MTQKPLTEKTFQVLEGGLARCPAPSYRELHSCWITDTRLMGVLVLCVRWKNQAPEAPDLYQYFYFDYEEYGFDRYEEYDGRDAAARELLEISLIGGLGSRKVAVTAKEAAHLVCEFLAHNRQHQLELPGDPEKYLFFEDRAEALSPKEKEILDRKGCVKIESKNGLANYFLMRCFGRDFQGAALLTEGEVTMDLLPSRPAGTFYRNKVLLSVEEEGCQCRSLVESGEEMLLVVTKLLFRGDRISDCRRISVMRLSPEEVMMNMGRPEFVTVCRFQGSPESLDPAVLPLLKQGAAQQEHGGKTFLIYQSDNSHVEKSDYKLEEDLMGVIHISGGQLLVGAATARNIRRIEIALYTSELAGRLQHQGAFEFTEPVLLRYLESPWEDFMAYLDAIRMDE